MNGRVVWPLYSHIILPSAAEIRQEAKGAALPIGFGAGPDQRGEEQLQFLAFPEGRLQVIPTAQDVAHRSRTDRSLSVIGHPG
jgi:hypothetical protein